MAMSPLVQTVHGTQNTLPATVENVGVNRGGLDTFMASQRLKRKGVVALLDPMRWKRRAGF